MARRIGVDGAVTDLAEYSLASIRAALDDGYLELVRLQRPRPESAALYVDEEGALKGLPLNELASGLADQPIVGPAVVITAAELEEDARGEADDPDEIPW